MSYSVKLCVFAACMLITGSINTIATKYQDITPTGRSPSGQVTTFKHPAVQSMFMFLGEALCFIPFVLLTWRGNLRSKGGFFRFHNESALHKLKTATSFAVPAICDAGATTLLNIGLFYTYASTFQMLRGTLVVFAGILTIVLLKRRLRLHHWMGITLICAGAALVGASSVIFEAPEVDGSGAAPGRLTRLLPLRGVGRGAPEAARDPLLGDVLVVVAQAAAATQFIVEEKYLTKYRVPALLAVSLEGFWGLAISAAALPLLSTYRGSDGLPLDSFPAAMQEIAASPQLLWSTVASVASIAFFNFFGISVTKRLSGASRATIDACRTLLIWMYSLWVGWETFHLLEVVGFLVLLSGSALYNEVIKACLPLNPAAEDLEAPLLGQPQVRAFAPVPASLVRGRGGGIPGRARVINQSTASPQYTLARSVLLNPSNLSPHSLASPGPMACLARAGSRPDIDAASGYGSAPDDSLLDGLDEEVAPPPRAGLPCPGSAPSMLHLGAAGDGAPAARPVTTETELPPPPADLGLRR